MSLSPGYPETVAHRSTVARVRKCTWCERLELQNPRAKFCSRRCRQAAFRLRRRSHQVYLAESPGTFAYADPPFPGLAAKYYHSQEVDHVELIASLVDRNYAGWALSTSPRALSDILPLCPKGARVCAWVKPIGVSPRTAGLHNSWEALIVVGGRKQRPGRRDWLRAQPARGWGDLIGRKPIAFCAWLFECLGMSPGDVLVDLFPGTGMVTRAWKEMCRSDRPGSLSDRRPRIPTTE